MNHKHFGLILILAALLLASMLGGAVLAQTSTNYNLEWHVIGGGGGPVSSASYMVRSTAGQGAASPPYSASGNYVVSGGYWSLPPGYRIYLPLVIKDI